MCERYLMILEISQKQAFIFESNKLRDNVKNSEIIENVTSPKYFNQICSNNKGMFDEDKNLVYSGGGHTILEFEALDKAKQFAQIITLSIRKEYRGLEAFVKLKRYDDTKKPSENIKDLIAELEVKKSKRLSAFRQGSFGLEALDSISLKPKVSSRLESNENDGNDYNQFESLRNTGYKLANDLSDLGGSKNISSFIAVVHIDGNMMGKRVEQFYRRDEVNESWESFKQKSRVFSEHIDKDFKAAFDEMVDTVIKNIESNKLEDLSLKGSILPIRKIIAAGDDICFVTDGRIGIECAAVFLEKLSKKINKIDNKYYSACAGVSIVHQKFPFYRAYELAESLCSNAKIMISQLDKNGTSNDGVNASAIDWHIEFGEMKDSLSDIREMYNTQDNKRLELRPYIVCKDEIYSEAEKYRDYSKFRKMVSYIQNKEKSVARGKLKELREILKRGEVATYYYIKSNKLDEFALEPINNIYNELLSDNFEIGTGELKRQLFVKTYDGEDRCLVYDAIEISDTFIELDRI